MKRTKVTPLSELRNKYNKPRNTREPYNRDSERTPGPGYADDGWGVSFKPSKTPVTGADEQLEELEDVSDELTDWETTFIDSLRDQRSQDRRLTDRQVRKLDQIYEERVLGIAHFEK